MLLSMSNHYQTRAPRRQNGAGWTLTIKYEEIHLKIYANGRQARVGIGSSMTFYNEERPHQAMDNQMPMAMWRAGVEKIEAQQELWICRFAWTTQTCCPDTHSIRSNRRRQPDF